MVTTIAFMTCLLMRDATPEATISGMFAALQHRDWKGVFSRFEGAKVDEAASLAAKLSARDKSMPNFTFKIGKVTSSSDQSTVSVTVTSQNPTGHGTSYIEETDAHLHLVDGDWKIVDGEKPSSIFSSIGMAGKNPSLLRGAQQSAPAPLVVSNMRQIELGILMYAADSDDKLTFTQATIKAKLKPYLKNDKLWLTSDGKPLDVRFNAVLAGKSLTSVSEPAKLVMLTIGPKDKLVYFDGKTPVGFVDGHVKFMTKDAVAGLKWK